MVTRELEEKSLRTLILALNEGLSVYGGLNKNFVPIKVSFSQCTYMTAMTAIGELVAYVSDLDRDICREPLCLDLDEMGSEDYWTGKLENTGGQKHRGSGTMCTGNHLTTTCISWQVV